MLFWGMALGASAPSDGEQRAQRPEAAEADRMPVSVADPAPVGVGNPAIGLPPAPLGEASARNVAPGVAVGNTYYDQQHNGTIGRMIDYGWDATSNLVVHFSWTDLPGPAFQFRGYGYSSYHTTGDSIIAEVHIQPSDHYAGYVNLDVDASNAAIVGGHEHTGDGVYAAQFYYDFCPAFACFANFPGNRVPDSVWQYGNQPDADYVIWPHIRYQEVPGNDPVLHVFAQEAMPDAADPQALYYFRRVGDVMSGSWDYPPYVVDTTFNIAQDVAASQSSGKMALVWNANRCADLSVCDTCSDNTGSVAAYSVQLDNDIYYQVSHDYGATFQPRVNLTRNEDGVPGYRPYADLSALITSDDDLHIAWSGRVWPADPDSEGVGLECSMFHWGEDLGFYPDGRGRIAKVADLEWEQTVCNGGAWQMNGSKMSISECNGKLYYLWVQFNDIPAGVENDCAQRGLDGTDISGSANGELYMSVSGDWGYTWDPARNLTNTRSPGCDPSGGAERCYSEHWPSMAEFGSDHPHGASVSVVDPSGNYGGDWFVDVQYVDDQDAGSIVKAEGSWTLNDMRWFRLACVDPVEVARLEMTPDNLSDAILISGGEQLDTTMTLSNYGNTELNYTLTTAELTGPEGWLTTTGLESGSLPAGPDGSVTGTIHLNAGGIVTSQSQLYGYLIFDGNFEGSPCSVEVECWVGADVLPVYDTVYVDDGSRAPALALVVSDDGNMGNQGVGQVNLDYFNYGDCDAYDPDIEEDPYPGDASVYLYDGSPVVCREEGGTPVCEASIFGRSWFDGGFLPGEHSSEDVVPDWLPSAGGSPVGDFFTSTFYTGDTAIQIDRCTFAPEGPAQPNWMVQFSRFTNLTDSDISGLAIGEVIDWDIPSDSANWNNSGFDASRGLIYQIGSEFDEDDECQDNNLRYGGLAVAGQFDGAGWSEGAYGMYSMDNSTQIYPFEGLNDDSLWKYMEQNDGFAISDSTDVDLHSVATYQWDYTLEAGSELIVYTCLVTEKEGEVDFLAACDDCLAYLDDLGPPPMECVIRGDIDHSGDGPNIADLVYLAGYMFSDGPEPPCMEEADVDGNGVGPNVSDLVYLVTYMFSGGPPPPPC
jgi:hypothetical protein